MAAAWCRWVICREVDLPALLRTARTVWSGERQVLGELLLVRRRWTEGGGDRALPPGLAQGVALRLLPPLLYLTLGGGAGPSAGLEHVCGGGRPAGDGLLCAGGAGKAAASRRGPRGP